MSISVIIPAYNASRFIAETLNSILRQTLPADEILVIDDGSTDDTADIAESFGSPVQVFRRPNSRQGASRNFGALQAKSEWIAFIDADDLWAENKLARQMDELAGHPEADLCYTARVEFQMIGDRAVFGPPIPCSPPQKARKELHQHCFFLPSSVLVRRSTFVESGGFATHFKITEDWDLWLRLLHSGVKFAACPEPLHLYRVHGNNATSDQLTMHRERLAVFQTRVLPYLTGPRKWIGTRPDDSAIEAEVAYKLRREGDPHCLRVMTRSLLVWPFGTSARYKAWLHMLLSRMNLLKSSADIK